MVNGSTLSSNSAAYGGGIYSTGSLTVGNSTFFGNSSGSFGGGVFSTGTLTVAGSTLAGNTTADSAARMSTTTAVAH